MNKTATKFLIILVTIAIVCIPNASILGVYLSGFPSDVLSFFDKWRITLGDGSNVRNLINYEHRDYFFALNDGTTDWVVYKTPNSGGTTPNSSNTRAELRQTAEWTPETGGNLTGTLKVMQVSTTGDARVPATFSVVIGQIHSDDGHENEPLKIFYKKFPGHTKGSVFWNYEINTEGSNSERWDISTAVWGYDWSVVGSDSVTYPDEPEDGIELDEEFSYEVNVYDGIMNLTFTSEEHPTRSFSKSLVASEYTNYSDIPQQVLTVFSSTGQDGTERANAYAGENQYFKQGSYNQTNGKNPADNMVWNTGAETYGGNLTDQYSNGSFAEVWFKAATVGPAVVTSIEAGSSDLESPKGFNLAQNYPNPFNPSTTISFFVKDATPVTIKIFDLLGKEITTLVDDERLAPGVHKRRFVADNIPAGIYFYRMQAGQFEQTRQLVLIK